MFRKLNKTDRCDRCGAQAYFLAIKGESELLFCAHHGRIHAPALEEQGFDSADYANQLQEENEPVLL